MLRDRSLVPLSHQHHNALALCVITERSLGEDSDEVNVKRLAHRIIDRYEIELINHFCLEEELVFPAARGAGLESLVSEFEAEHRLMERQVEEIRRSPSAELLIEFVTLLRAHIRREENELFQQTQGLLSREELDRLGSELDARVVRVCL